ncbi:MAG TPA: TonB family protein [Opitutaceae bacterium]|nr:TonB family protein [Opitutaceae bacterium]
MNTPIVRATFTPLLAAALMLTSLEGATVPPKFNQTVQPRFPAALDFTAISSGEADVMLKIDAIGQLIDVLVVGYSHKEFGREAAETVRQWKYEPAVRDGEPIESRVRLSIKFTSNARVVTLMPLETPAALLRGAGIPESVNLVCNASDLDRPLVVVQTATPVHPGRTAAFPEGHTVVDFYVDETGRARLPMVVETTHPAFSVAAVHALADWKFAVPTRGGRPTIVRMQQTFVFENGT